MPNNSLSQANLQYTLYTANTPILASTLLAGNSAYFNGNYVPISGTLLIDVNLTAIG